jgi:hypothetical protein
MYSRHEEHSAIINASAERVFYRLDDQTRLSEHMSKRSWKMGGAPANGGESSR